MNTPLFQNEWTDQTTLHPLGLAITLACGLLMLVLPRRYALWPMIAAACFVSPAQRLVVASLDFDVIRLLVLFGVARLFLRRELAIRPWALDWVVIAWALVSVVMPTLTFGSTSVMTNKLGYAFDAIGIYFLCRCLVRDTEDLKRVVAGFALFALPVAALFMVEWSTGRNMFSAFGGVPEITDVRNGRLRCQGAFAHPILAGCFWAGVLPLVASMWWNGWRAVRVALGAGACLLIVLFCSSSTPVMAVIFCAIGAAFFPLRNHMRLVRWSLLGIIVLLHLVMKAPVWHLIGRIDIISGSTGWHRFNLVDGFIRNVHEWFLTGSTVGTAHWAYGAEDVTNLYVVQGLNGGILQLALFIAMISLAFAGVGRQLRATQGDRGRHILAWALGVALFAHVLSFLAVSYFGQINLLWYLTLGAIGSLAAAPAAIRSRAPVRPTIPIGLLPSASPG